MADQQKDVTADFDLDEDLFNFDEVMPDESGDIEEEIDLDEIFAAFQEEEDEAPQEEEEPKKEPLVTAARSPLPSEPEEEEEEEYEEEEEEELAAEVDPQPRPRVTRPTRRRPEPAVAYDDDDEPYDDDPEPVQPKQPKRRSRRADRTRRTRRSRKPAAGVAPRAVTFLTKGAVVVLIAMTLLNVSIALVTFSSATGMRQDLEAASREMADAALEIRDQVGEQTDAVKQQFSPVVPPTLDAHPTFDRAVADIEVGNFLEGRQRIYALLAVIDRQSPDLREELEARAAYLLARSYHAEAAAAGGGDE